jgi:hypothetical protein
MKCIQTVAVCTSIIGDFSAALLAIADVQHKFIFMGAGA